VSSESIERGAPRAAGVANVRTRASSVVATSPATAVTVQGCRHLAASNPARAHHAPRVKARDAPRGGAARALPLELDVIRLDAEKWLRGTARQRAHGDFGANVVGRGRPMSYSPLPSCSRGGIFAT
jgi:hypothetical protein